MGRNEFDSEFNSEFDQRSGGNDENPLPPVEIPIEVLSSDALAGVIENYIVREGTDYGVSEITHETKIRQIQKQLEAGDIKIVFDPNTESVTLMTERDFEKLTGQAGPLSSI